MLITLERVEIEEVRNKGEAKDPRWRSATYLLYSITAVILGKREVAREIWFR